MVAHLKIHPLVTPAIVLCGLIAGFGMSDLWQLVAALLAAWFVNAEPWDPFENGKIRERKSNDAPE